MTRLERLEAIREEFSIDPDCDWVEDSPKRLVSICVGEVVGNVLRDHDSLYEAQESMAESVSDFDNPRCALVAIDLDTGEQYRPEVTVTVNLRPYLSESICDTRIALVAWPTIPGSESRR